MLFFNKYKKVLIFCIPAIIISSLYFWDIIPTGEFPAFLTQFRNDPNLNPGQFTIYSPLIKLFEEHKRFFHSPMEISLTILLILSFIFANRVIRKDKLALIYFLTSVISLGAITHGKTSKYLLIYLPFIAIIISTSIAEVFGNFKNHTLNSDKIIKGMNINRNKVKWIFTCAIILFVTINLYLNYNYIFSGYDYVSRNAIISSLLPEKQTKVMAREWFYFNEMKDFTINIFMAYEFYSGRYNHIPMTKEGLFNFAASIGDKYIILENLPPNRHLLKLISFDKLYKNDSCGPYFVRYKDESLIIFEKYH
jgi:hypothetical protein